MWDKFGEFDSAEELNRAAAAQLAEGDTEAVLAIAKENGIDPDDAQAFIDGEEPELASIRMAAYGKLDIEKADLKLGEILEDWEGYIRLCCTEDEQMAIAVRRKGKSLSGCIAKLMKWSFEHKIQVSKEICKAAGLTRDPIYIGIPGQATVKKLITEYYLGGES